MSKSQPISDSGVQCLCCQYEFTSIQCLCELCRATLVDVNQPHTRCDAPCAVLTRRRCMWKTRIHLDHVAVGFGLGLGKDASLDQSSP